MYAVLVATIKFPYFARHDIVTASILSAFGFEVAHSALGGKLLVMAKRLYG